MAGMVNRLDVNEVVTVDGSSEALDTSGMGQISVTAEVSSLTGSGARVQVEVQASDDAVNWSVVHDTRRITADGFQRLSGIRISSKYYRYYWFVGGTSPSGTLRITTTLKDYSPQRTGSMFRYDDLDLTSGTGTSTPYNVFSNSEVGCMFVRSSDARGSATIKFQGSNDGVTWHDHTGDVTITAGQTLNREFSGNSHRFIRAVVVSAASGSGAATMSCLWNSTGGA